jgi:hypothetical protein
MNKKLEFDSLYWGEVIQKPDWYLELVPYMKKVQQAIKDDREQAEKFTKTIRHFFEQGLENNLVALADKGPNLDAERQPVDTIVIHHTSAKPGYKISYMNAVQLLNIYAPYYANPTIKGERGLRGKAIWSGHFLNNKPSFIGYHWLMRMNGNLERLLNDDQIGWHAGNWDINKRSVGICLDNDYENQDPTQDMLKKLAELISKNYSNVSTDNIMGHNEAAKAAGKETKCPGTNFEKIWKRELVELLA